jgi:hypothetical protein
VDTPILPPSSTPGKESSGRAPVSDKPAWPGPRTYAKAPADPCPKCDGHGRCYVSVDGEVAACRNKAEGGKEDKGKDGLPVWYHNLRPTPLPVLADSIPEWLKSAPRWLVWRYKWKPPKKKAAGKWDKPPLCAKNGKAASSTDPATWSTFDDAVAAYRAGGFDGVGVVVHKHDQLTADGELLPLPDSECKCGHADDLIVLDLDKCRDPATGALQPWAAEIVAEVASYSEVSPSNCGVRIIARGRKPGERCRDGLFEMYETGRYVTVTGRRLPDTPADVNERQEAIVRLYDRKFTKEASFAASKSKGLGKLRAGGSRRKTSDGPPNLTDDQVLDHCRRAANNGKFNSLWAGDIAGYGDDDSAADGALSCLLAFFTRDFGQIERIFDQSTLGKRDKWRDRGDYRRMTIDTALETVTDWYQPSAKDFLAGAKKTLQALSEQAKNDPVAAVDTALKEPSLAALALLSKGSPGDVEAFYRLLTQERKVKAKEVDGLRKAVRAAAAWRREQQKAEAAEAAATEEDGESESKLRIRSGYIVKNGMICHEFLVGTQRMVEPLCNFNARIVEESLHDDGIEQSTFFVLKGKVCAGPALPKIEVPASEFEKLAWVTTAWGSAPIIDAARGVRDQLRAAILHLSAGTVVKHTVYTHLGWRKDGGDWFYLHAGGAISEDGPILSLETAPPEPLAKFVLPTPPTGEALKVAVRASLGLLSSLAPDWVAFPVILAPYRAVLGDCDFSLHLVGPTGVFKSELAALAEQHHGLGLDARNFPGNWSSTANSLEGLAFAAKDALLVVDDFAPGGSSSDVQRFHREADRLLRAQGNKSGRGRMRTDGTLRPANPPRGLILSTGEDVPRGSSLRSRMLVVEVSKGDVASNRLTECQRDAAVGLYAQALAGFVRWLAPQYGELCSRLRQEQVGLREKAATAEQHARTPALMASMGIGLRYMVDFAVAVGAVSEGEAADLSRRGWAALRHAAEEQEAHIAAAEPAGYFLRLISSAVASGRAHLASRAGGPPMDARAWGWRTLEKVDGRDGIPIPQGRRIGWLDGEHIHLEPHAAFAEAQRLAVEQGETLTTTLNTTLKRMHDRNLIQADTSAGKIRYTFRRKLEGQTRSVVLLPIAAFNPAERGGDDETATAPK